MRKLKVYRLVCLAGEALMENGGLPDGVENFFGLVRQYSEKVLPDITEEEVAEMVYNPLSDLFGSYKDIMWRGKTISHRMLSRTAQLNRQRLRRKHKINSHFPPVLCEKSGRGHYLFVPPEWGNGDLEFKIAMELYANTPGVMRVV